MDLLRTIVRDLRFAGRMLRRSPGFTVTAVLVITLGAGAVSTIFSAANAIASRPLPGASNPGELVEVLRTRPDGPGSIWASYPYYRHLVDSSGAAPAADIAAWSMMPLTIGTGSEGVASQGSVVTGNYFRVLGMRPALGRFFTADEDLTPGAHPVVVVSHAFWTTRLAGDSAAVGRTVRLNGSPYTLIGVAAPGFGGVFVTRPIQAWLPLAMLPEIRPGGELTDPGPSWLQLFARVPASVDRAVVERELSRRTARYVADGHEPDDGRPFTTVRIVPLANLPADTNGRVLGFLALLLGASGLVLLIASANVAAMLLARAVARRRETAVRLALGATRGRLVRQLLTESLLLYVLGAVGGVLVAVNGTGLLQHLPLPVSLPVAIDLSPDVRVLAFTLVVSLVTGIAFGVAPALQSARVDVEAQLRDDSAGAGTRRSTVRSALIAGQMAVSLLLLVTAGLFLRALDEGQHIALGFDPANVAVAGFNVGTYGYDDAKERRFYGEVKERMAQAPGVVAVSYARNLPMGIHHHARLRIGGSAVPPDGERATPVRFGEVDAGYFDVMRMPIVEGRAFTAADDARAPRVAVVNQAFARRHWPDGAVGRTFHRDDEVFTVVGVARDAKYSSLGEALEPYVYFAIAQAASPAFHAALLVRTSGDPMRLAPAIRDATRAFDPLIPAPTVTTLSAEVSDVLAPRRVAALVTAALGLVGLLLACVGLYGSVAYQVGQRKREIGVRLALGAAPRDVQRVVVREGMRPVAVGLAFGILLALSATRLVRAYLFGVSPLDALTFAGGGAILTAVAAAACWLPARRAAAMDPARALRGE